MSDETTTAELSELNQAKQRIKSIRKKMAKGRGQFGEHTLTHYLLNDCPVLHDQLELTPEELAKVEEMKENRARWKREAEERVRQELASRKAMVEESASKAKQTDADRILEVDPALLDALQAGGIHFVRFSFEPYNRGWGWGRDSGICWGADYKSVDRPVYQPNPLREKLDATLDAIEAVAEAWLKARFPDHLVKGTIDLHVTDRIAYCDYQKVTSWSAQGVSDPNGFVGIQLDDDELWEGVETLDDVKGLFESISSAMSEVNDYKTQVAHCSTHVQEVIGNTPGLATFELMTAMVEDMLSAIANYGGDKYSRDFRIVRCPEDADEPYAIVDLESYDYNTDDVEVIGGLGYHDSYAVAA